MMHCFKEQNCCPYGSLKENIPRSNPRYRINLHFTKMFGNRTSGLVWACRMSFCTKHNYPVDTGRKLNVYKTSRRRPGRLLNVLCTFNLRPVSTGLEN